MRGGRSTVRRMIPPGPRTVARRQYAAELRVAWERLSPADQQVVSELPRSVRARLIREVAAKFRESG